jgi:hypothetical protein
VRLVKSDGALIGVMMQRCVDRACEGGDENETQGGSGESCLEFYGDGVDLVCWCDMCLMSASINTIQALKEGKSDDAVARPDGETLDGLRAQNSDLRRALATAEQHLETVKGERDQVRKEKNDAVARAGEPVTLPPERATAPTDLPDLVRHLERQSAFSEKTFGPGVRTAGVVDHIRKELREIEAKPHDLSEWIDVVILAFDGAWRAGYLPAEIVAALVAKQTKNEARRWPDWRTAAPDKAIEHVRGEREGAA